MSRRPGAALAAIAATGALAVLMLPGLERTHCGGNSAALHVCERFAGVFRDNARGRFLSLAEWAGAGGTVDIQAALSPGGFWSTEDFLVLDPKTPISTMPDQPILACAREYGNVPQPTVWNLYCRNPAHAAAFSDGTLRLLTPAEFASLDRSRFINAASWVESLRGR